MIQSVPPSSLPSLMPVESLLQPVPEGTAPADFGALLALGLPGQVNASASVAPAAKPVEGETASATEPIPAPASGNFLPPALPPIAAATAPMAAPVPVEPEQAQPAALVQPSLIDPPKNPRAHGAGKMVAAPHRDAPARDAKAAPGVAETPTQIVPFAVAESAVPPVGQASAEPVQVAPPITAQLAPSPIQAPPPAASATAQEPLTEADAPRGAPAPRPIPARAEAAAQALAAAPPQAAFRRSAAPSTSAAESLPQAVVPAATAVRSLAPPVLRVEIALPAAAPADRPAEVRPVLRRANTGEALPAPAPTPSAGLTVQQPAAAPPSAAAPASVEALRPHDFATLVDRLVAAREAVQPHAATLTIAHAEFGPVELRFRHEERGVAVTLASADPDFARAAAAAPQPVMPLAAGAAPQGETGQSAQPRDTSTSTAGSSGGQPRGQQGERRGEQSAQSNHAPRGSARPGSERRSGIFA